MTDPDFMRFNPLRRPDWRFERVLGLVDRFPTPGRCSFRDDEFVRRARRFVLRWRASSGEDDRAALWRDEPGLYYAYMLHDLRSGSDKKATFVLEARLLSGQPFREIARSEGTIEDAVRWYEALFFNVADSLDKHDWVLRNVLMPAAAQAKASRAKTGKDGDRYVPQPVVEPHLDYSLKFFAYYGGHTLLDYMLSEGRVGQRVSSLRDCPAYFDDHHEASLKVRATQLSTTYEWTKFDVEILLAAHARFVEISKRYEEVGGRETVYERSIAAVLKEFPWAAGRNAPRRPELAVFEDGDAELRDDELLLAAAGAPPDGLDEVPTIKMPAPTKKGAAGTGGKDADSDLFR